MPEFTSDPDYALVAMWYADMMQEPSVVVA